eukprot:855767-Prorocentrum_minimum.AAC.12
MHKNLRRRFMNNGKVKLRCFIINCWRHAFTCFVLVAWRLRGAGPHLEQVAVLLFEVVELLSQVGHRLPHVLPAVLNNHRPRLHERAKKNTNVTTRALTFKDGCEKTSTHGHWASGPSCPAWGYPETTWQEGQGRLL